MLKIIWSKDEVEDMRLKCFHYTAYCNISKPIAKSNFSDPQFADFFTGVVDSIDEDGIFTTHTLTGCKNFYQFKNVIGVIEEQVLDEENPDHKKIINDMWSNYGRILSEYVFIKDFRNSKLSNNISIEGQEILEKIKQDSKPVIFISGHFNNFELNLLLLLYHFHMLDHTNIYLILQTLNYSLN